MQAISAEKPVKAFIIISMKRILFRLIVFLPLLACDREEFDDFIPFVPFSDQFINLNNLQYADLQFNGGWVYLNNVGVKGLIIYRENSSTYRAFERNCSYQPNEACATVNVDQGNLFMEDPCCGSSFSFPMGQPIAGPAAFPLRRYITALDGNTLIITDGIDTGF